MFQIHLRHTHPQIWYRHLASSQDKSVHVAQREAIFFKPHAGGHGCIRLHLHMSFPMISTCFTLARHFSKVEINGLEISDGRRWAGKVNVRFCVAKAAVSYNMDHGRTWFVLKDFYKVKYHILPYLLPRKSWYLTSRSWYFTRSKIGIQKFSIDSGGPFKGPEPWVLLSWCWELPACAGTTQFDAWSSWGDGVSLTTFSCRNGIFHNAPNPKQIYLPSSSNLFWCSHWATGTCISLSKSLS